MAKFFQPLRELSKRAQTINYNKLINLLIQRPDFTELIIRLNTDEQLFKEGINSLGIRLDAIGGAYSAVTVEIKKLKGQPFDRVTLRDTGEFHESWRVIAPLSADFFEITADPEKDDTNLFKEWGVEIVGLTEENLDILRNKLKNEITPLIIKAILG